MVRAWIAVKRGFAGVKDFRGRSSRTDFWFYAVFIVGLAGAVWGTVMSIEIARTFAEVHQYAAQHPEKVTITTSATNYSVAVKGGARSVGPNVLYLFVWITAIGIVSIALLAASAVRRLHDTGRTGWWICLPISFLMSSLWLSGKAFDETWSMAGPNRSWFLLGFANNLVYLATLGFVAFLLLRSGTPGENRFGIREMEDEA